LIIWCLYADFKHISDQNHREKSCYVASEFIAHLVVCWLEFVKILIFITVDIFTHCQQNKKIKRADHILPEVYVTTLRRVWRVWRYQRGSKNPYIEEEQTTQWPKEKVQKNKQRSTTHTYKTKDRVTRTPLKTRGELICSGRDYFPEDSTN
jgi:hypothetical protein